MNSSCSFASIARSFAFSALALALLVPATARAGGGSTTFVPTYTKAYQAAEYTDLGLAPATMPLQIVLGLAPRNAAQIDVLLKRMATPGDPLAGVSLSTAQTTALFGQTSATVKMVESYLSTLGFKDVAVSPDALLVSATGTVAEADAAFATKIDAVKIGGLVTYANVLRAEVPASLGGSVVAVEGLSGERMHADRRSPLSATSCTSVPVLRRCVAGAFSAGGLRTFYDTTGVASASATTLAILTAGDVSALAADVGAGEAAAGIAAVPLSVVRTGAASTDTSQLAEWDLDAQTALGVAGGAARLVAYDANALGESDLTQSLARFESDDLARAASASFGICEDVASTDGSMLVDDTLLAIAALHGQTLFAATGDRLSACPARQYPASSRYAVAVGATTALVSTATTVPNSEVAWYAADGGPSAFESAPFWQSGIVSATVTAANVRAIPDIVLDGDPNTGALVVVGGSQMQFGGSSLATALALGLWGCLETAHGNGLGFAATRLYREFGDLRTAADASPAPGTIEQKIGGFRDLLIGTNGLPAGPEYDFATGLGSLDARLQALDVTR